MAARIEQVGSLIPSVLRGKRGYSGSLCGGYEWGSKLRCAEKVVGVWQNGGRAVWTAPPSFCLCNTTCMYQVYTESVPETCRNTTGSQPMHQGDMPPIFSFGTAFFGAQPADGSSSYGKEAPDSLRAAFTAQHTDGAARLGLITSCAASRELVLAHSPSLTIRIDTRAEQDGAAWDKQLSAVQQALLARGMTGRTTLTIELSEGAGYGGG